MKFAGVFLIFSCLYQPFASASEFAGSWKRDDTQTRLNPAPSLVIEKNSGGYHVKWSTGAAYDVIFDSREHPLPAPNLFNAASFRRTDAKTIEQDGKRAGKDAGKIVWTVSPDGQELHQITEGMYQSGQHYHNDAYLKRLSGAPGEDPFAATWQTDSKRSVYSAPMVYTINDVENGIELKTTGGLSFTARFDEKPYPTSINPAGNTVTLKRIDDRTLRAVYRPKDGTVYRTSTLAVSGGTLTETSDVADPAGTPFQSFLVFRRQ
jgi:hypothetical protein